MMSVYDLYSKRQRRLRGEVPEVYQYDSIPEALRVQIVHIWHDAIGIWNQHPEANNTYAEIVNVLCREYGTFWLVKQRYRDHDYFAELRDYFLKADPDNALDIIELSFLVIDKMTRDPRYLNRSNANKVADRAIAELNVRFKEHAVGYQFISGKIIRVDTEIMHESVVKPALRLLRNPQFAGAEAEFLKAHEQYRHGNSKEALSECLKSFESVMKSICDKRGWPADQRATSRDLIKTCFDHNLLPQFWSHHLSGLRNILESAIPSPRNKLSSHGQGAGVIEVPLELAEYVIHMTAATIVFLVKADQKLTS